MQEERCVGAGGIIYTFLSRHVATALPLFRGCRQLAPVFPSIPLFSAARTQAEAGRLDRKAGDLRSFLMLHPKHSGVRADPLLPPIAHCSHGAAPTGCAEGARLRRRGNTITQG